MKNGKLELNITNKIKIVFSSGLLLSSRLIWVNNPTENIMSISIVMVPTATLAGSPNCLKAVSTDTLFSVLCSYASGNQEINVSLTPYPALGKNSKSCQEIQKSLATVSPDNFQTLIELMRVNGNYFFERDESRLCLNSTLEKLNNGGYETIIGYLADREFELIRVLRFFKEYQIFMWSNQIMN